MTLDFTATKVVDAQSVSAASELALSNCTATDCSDFVAAGIGGTIAFNASATGDAIIKVYFAYDGTNYADLPSDQYTVTCVAGATKEFVFGTLPLAQNMKIGVENEDASYALTANIWVHDQADA